MSSTIVASRSTSAFPLSIGTSLSMESISNSGGTPYDPERQIPQHVQIRDYKEFWINLSTLFRNLYGAIPRADITNVSARDCADALLQEIRVIDDIIQSESYSLTKTVYYICNYTTLKSRYPKANIRGFSTSNQLAYKALHDKTIQLVLNEFASQHSKLKVFDCDLIPDERLDTLILTHSPHDLISGKRFKSLDLLESHTGKLKKKNLWYSKYYQGKDLVMMPFNSSLLQALGDNEMFHPLHISLRRDLLELAKSKNWTFATTHSKVKDDIKTLKNPYASFVMKTL